MKTLRQACVPRPATFDPARRDTVLDLSDLIADRIDPAAFFAENHVTEGMRTLLTEGFRRLEGKSAQGVFKLTQAMGGGKTHNLLALGLLAKQPELRAQVMGGFYRPDDIGPVRVVAFSGRESDPPLGVWGAIADQLGKRSQFNDYYSPLSAPGQTAWVNLLRGEPLVIMLDELSPYLVDAASKSGAARFLAQFHSAIRESFTTLHYPTRDRFASVDFSMEFRENRYDGEQQVVAALEGKQKYTEDVAGETFRKKVEARLFTQPSILWSEVLRRVATEPGWQWHRSDALERLKQEDAAETASEFGNRELGDSAFARSLVRHALYAVWLATENDGAEVGRRWLRDELPEDAAAARIVAGAVENDHV